MRRTLALGILLLLASLALAVPAPALAACRPQVAAPTSAVPGNVQFRVGYTACATGTYRFRLVNLGSDPALRGLVRARHTVFRVRRGKRRLDLRAAALPGLYALSMELPSGRRLRAPRAVRVRRPAPGSSGPLCSAGQTIVRTAEARAFTVKDGVFACHGDQRRAWFIGRDGEEACFPDRCDIGRVALAGSWLVYGAANTGRYGSQFEAVRVDLLTGNKVGRVAAGTLTEKQKLDTERGINAGRGPVNDLVVKRNGSLAFIYEDRYETGEHGVVIDDLDGTRYVESVPDIRPGSLAITGENQVTWTQGERQVSEPLR